MIFIALGANLPGPWGPPRATLDEAVRRLEIAHVKVLARSRYWRTAPQPPSGQPWYWNAVVKADSALSPANLLAVLHEIEAQLGRERSVANAARAIDLDLLDHRGAVIDAPELLLPHPRLAERAFVLLPLAEVAPAWRHPISGRPVAELIAALPPGQEAEPV